MKSNFLLAAGQNVLLSMCLMLTCVVALNAHGGDSAPSYTLAVPYAPRINNSSDSSDNEWLELNQAMPLAAAYGAVKKETPLGAVATIEGRPIYSVKAVEVGYPIERAKPQYWLGDLIVPPANVDWDATSENYKTNIEEQASFIFDLQGKRVFVSVGGTKAFTWVLNNGANLTQVYTIASVVKGRPYRFYWTDHPYDGPTIDLSGKFVKFFGKPSVIDVKYGVQTNYVSGLTQIVSNSVVRGIYLDPSTKLLFAYGDVRGQFILAYYDSGAFDTLKHIQVVEVGPPDVVEMKGTIGKRLVPSGAGYATTGLTASPRANAPTDNRGEYYYQHKGMYSYSPKNGDVYPLRPTMGESWRLPVYWMEYDPFGTSWPFELCHYSCDWGENVKTLVAGGKVIIPSDYTPMLMAYQEPERHAKAPENNEFITSAAGYSLLKIASKDDVWFIPFHSVLRTDKNYFTLEPEDWLVGSEVVPRGGFSDGTAANYSPQIDYSVAGFINKVESGDNYHHGLYIEPMSDSNVQTNLSESITSGDTNTYESVIYAVTTHEKPLEVWWSGSVLDEGMTLPVTYPTLVQRYNIKWPRVSEVPQIVIASQQGSAGECVYEMGVASLLDTYDASLAIDDRLFFLPEGGMVSFWAKNKALEHGTNSILTVGASGKGLDVDVLSTESGDRYRITLRNNSGDAVSELLTESIPSYESWHHITFSFGNSNICAYVDGKLSAFVDEVGTPDLSGKIVSNAVGAIQTRKAARGYALDDIAIWSLPLDAERISALCYEELSPATSGLTCLFSFTEEELLSLSDSSLRYATERIYDKTVTATHVSQMSPGAPRKRVTILEADKTPIVYYQNNNRLPAYNPNEEHAFITAGNGGYVAWALRCDLNMPSSSMPGVLVEYVKDGKKRMSYFSVVLTNDVYSSLADTATVGTVLPGPQPLTNFDDPWLPQTYWEAVENNPVVAFRDRKKQIWSRCAGELPIHMYYSNQEGFYYPSIPANNQPEIGAAIPWLSSLGKIPDAGVNLLRPATWTWTVSWPKNVETMRIGQTLTTASTGLPEVWNAKSMAVVYPDDGHKTVMLYDPTVIQRSGSDHFVTAEILAKSCGFSTGDSGNVTLRSGKYRIKDLPPSISDRFYIDTTMDATDCLCLKGALESKTGGGSVLYVNVLNDDERAALKAAVSADNANKSRWDEMIDRLAIAPVVPSTSKWERNITDEENVLVTDYIPRDHYALTAMGATNYVVLIENDATNKLMNVDVGDPISMHVFAVTNRYYAGDVYARQDPENLLSQRLSILYAESFGGRADDYVFEWKKASPNANGVVPTDYENVFKRKFELLDSIGLTRFILGGQGDTLADLVNTYYVCRYRAKDNTAPAYAVMGDSWSDWCGPTLAEGWVQRVLNNITPFSQRMVDLYENEAEMTATAIQSAGAPYEGDVALNQDNLTSIGLIQLYQTVLNKAESLSVSLGMNNTDANKQLLLATERLADLYVLLGNEAYSDALNPTIGFGSSYGASGVGMNAIDYGAESSSLFCFDNQVSSLLDEELALLRGRTGENAPHVRTAPYHNRLVWNFTKGITAGEVAYAVNYNVNSANNDATIDAEDAAVQYPQGHGDAYGHYLSALSSFYRLLRNPYFSWTVGMGEMLVNDAVVNEDYYDEQRFAEAAAKLSQTAQDIVDKTARQTWRDNKGVSGAGYLDENTSRNFGYGEWGTRGGVGSVMNWMVANSILPEAKDASKYYRLYFDGSSSVSLNRAPCGPAEAPSKEWTFECQIAPDTEMSSSGEILKWESENAILTVAAQEKTWTVAVAELSTTVLPVTNIITSVVTNDQSFIIDGIEETITYVPLTATNNVVYKDCGSMPPRMILAITHSQDGSLSVRAIDPAGEKVVDPIIMSSNDLNTVDLSEGNIVFGRQFRGYISEFRFWEGIRDDDDLASAAAFVNPRSSGLVSSVRAIAARNTETLLEDEVGADSIWTAENPVWESVSESGFDIAFSDAGLLRIDRASVTDLKTLALSVPAIQRTMDRLDSGLNPLGLSESAIPFDITPLGVSDGTSSHFEQISARAETALANAGKVLDRAQSLATRLRMVQNSVSDEEELAAASEASYKKQLIEIFGYPYSGDIGPAGTYVQGYDGPDLLHYMWMDLSQYGLTKADDIKEKAVLKYNVPQWSLNAFFANYVKETARNELKYSMSANGLIIKPDTIKGTRLAGGKLQQAYADYINAYVELSNAIDWYDRKSTMLKLEATGAEISLAISQVKLLAYSGVNVYRFIKAKAALAVKLALIQVNASMDLINMTGETVENSTPGIIGAGLTVNTDPSAIVSAAVGSIETPLMTADIFAKASLETMITSIESSTVGELIASELSSVSNFSSEKTAIRDRLLINLEAQFHAAVNVQSAWGKMLSAAEAIDSLVAEGERILVSRQATRAKRVNRLTKLRYNDMYFRIVQNQALARYASAFDLAQKYVFLATQAYDYETGMLAADASSGDEFRAEIIGARTLGKLDDDGKPMLANGVGDAGLSDILARLNQNWLVLKPRLGINNPENYATWFSLRSELFRIAPGASGDAAWRKELEKYRVNDLRSIPEYTRYCQPFSDSSGSNTKEPGFVIPFSTHIDFAKNFFGNNLSAGDSAFDSTYYATKIAGAGIRLAGYNEGVNGYMGGGTALAATPVVYLLPVGADRMRVPGAGEKGTILDFNVVDQVVPAPFAIGSAELDDPDWTPLYTGYTGNVDPLARIRRYPSFRAVTGAADDSGLKSTRLIGRSVWNTRWVLIIPAGQLLGGSSENRETALDTFIYGKDLNRDGVTDISGVADIQFGLKTYSNSGN